MKYKKNNGFTLIELLVVIGVFIVLVTIVLSVIFTVFRGTTKSDSIIIVKQNGEYALSQMVKKMRFAKSLNIPSTVGGSTPSCSSGGVSVQSVQVTNVDLSTSVFSCPLNNEYPNYIDMNGVRLTNSNEVIVSSCYFLCKQEVGHSPTISIVFNLTKVNSSGLPEGNTSIPFQSSVTLRNVGQ